jgi:hypothetical protein
MGLSITRPLSADGRSDETTTRGANAPVGTSAPASSSWLASVGGVLAGLPRNSASGSQRVASRQEDAWSEIAAHIRNPASDARVSKLIGMLETLHQSSPTLRSRLARIAREGGITITIADAGKMPHAFTHPGKRRIHISAEIATDTSGQAARSLPALAVEISNLCRHDEFETLNRHFRNGRLQVAHAARLKEGVEYGSIGDMVRYFSEARGTLERMGFGNPSLWYARIGPYRDIRGTYPTLNDYLRVAIKSGHTAGYERQFSNIAAQMSATTDASVKPVHPAQT